MENLRKTLANFMRNMKSKFQSQPNLKLILLASILILLTIFILRSSFSPSPLETNNIPAKDMSLEGLDNNMKCNKIPKSLARAIIHYSTSKTTPQQTIDEISVSAAVLDWKSPCNFLVFGLGHDSLMWASLNHGGRTVFLEEDRKWIDAVREKEPTLESYHVVYNTKVKEADGLIGHVALEECTKVGEIKTSQCPLALKELPNLVHEIEWDLIMVDAPTGYFADAPGRMGAIYTAGMMARGRMAGETHVFVHDVDRVVEDKFSKTFLCERYMTKQEGRLRHFTIPSHRERSGVPFCP